MYKYKGYDIRDIVDNSQWQNVRKSLLNNWKLKPIKNVNILKNYLKTGNGNIKFRALRIYNYLTGTAFRIGMIKHKEIDKLKKEVKRLI